MCEIAILRPADTDSEVAMSVAERVYESQGHSIGAVAVHENDSRTKFDYRIFKAVTPDRDSLRNFIDGAFDDGAARLILHGRMATHGEVNIDNAHPLRVNCPECDVDYVLHNGVLGMHEYAKQRHERQGHEYNTDVDSEVIAHEYGEVPTDFDHSWEYTREPAYILLNEEAVFVSAGNVYHLTEDMRMQLRYRNYPIVDDSEQKYVRGLLKPAEVQ